MAFRPLAIVVHRRAGDLRHVMHLLSNPGHTLRYHIVLIAKLLLAAHVFAVAVLISRPSHPRRRRLMAGGAISSLVVIGIAVYLRSIF
jgi:hypothetical protein